jgi:esterase/lipase
MTKDKRMTDHKLAIHIGLLLTLVTAIGAADTASAITEIHCSVKKAQANQSTVTTTLHFSEREGILSETSANGTKILANELHIVKGAKPHTIDLTFVDGTVPAALEISGNPMEPKVELVDTDGRHLCSGSNLEELFEKMISDRKKIEGIAKWKNWVAKRPKPCGPGLDSEGFLQADAGDKVALVLHGFSSSPPAMNGLVKMLVRDGYNVIVPRLAKHFDKNLHDLDRVKYTEWLDDAEETFKIARQFGNRVTLVGYSLGGLLSARLALAHKNEIDRMVLFAPAWRVSSEVDEATLIGNLLGKSLNDFTGVMESCHVDGDYIPASGGRQVLDLIEATEEGFHGAYPSIEPTAFHVDVPHLILTSPTDEAIDAGEVEEICANNFTMCKNVEIPNRQHETMLSALDVKVPYEGRNLTVEAIILNYLRER